MARETTARNDKQQSRKLKEATNNPMTDNWITQMVQEEVCKR